MKKIFVALFAATLLSSKGEFISLSQGQHGEVLLSETRTGPEFLLTAATRVATLRLTTGGSIDFLNVGDGEIALGERTPRAQPFISAAMVRQWNATPLEMFMALAPPGTVVPEALKAAALRPGQSSPRDLKSLLTTLDLDDPGVEVFDCDAFGTNFYYGWLDTFAGLTTYADAKFFHFFSYDQYTFYPGGYINSGGTITPGYNQSTYLGACNGDDDTPFTLEIHRRIAYPTPPSVTYVWANITQVILNDDEKYTFHSNIPASYRGRVIASDIIDHLGIGVAYTKAQPLGIAF